MATLAVSFASVAVRRSFASTFALFMKEIKYEFLKLFRTKSFSLSVIGFPVMFYVLFGIGVGLASERSAGWLELKRASPMPAMAYLLAKCVTAIAFGLIITCVLIAVAMTSGGVSLTELEIAKMLLMTVGGTIPFASMGLLVALLVPANAASGVVNLIYLPMSFMSGLWIPLQYLPAFLRHVAPFLPTYHLVQLMLRIFGYQNGSSTWSHVAGLLGFTLLMLGASWAVFHRAELDA
jgi:ABC-2 type transport system permease protein